MTELCIYCKKRPINVRKWKLCDSCYGKLRRNGKLQSIPKYKVYHKVTYPKISNECISDMIKEGFTTAQIGKTCNISRQAVHQRVNKEKYKVYTTYHNHYEIIFLHKIGFAPKDIEKLVNKSIVTVYRVLKRYSIKKPIKATTKQIAWNMYGEGKTPQEIATSLDMSIGTIYNYLTESGQYKPAHTRDKNKHTFEVNFLKRLGFTTKEVHKYIKLSESQILLLTTAKFKKTNSKK